MPDKENRSSSIRTHVVEVSNISPLASREQLHNLFSYLGRIEEMKIYPSEMNPLASTSLNKFCYVRFGDTDSADSAQHLTNTALIDRAIICIPVVEDRIPDEETALQTGGPTFPGQRALPSHLVNQIQMVGNQQAMVTIDSALSSMGVPNYPPLPSNTDALKLEEIRRTVYVGNIPKDASTDELLDFFGEKIGEVMYMRFAGADDLPVRYLYVEFANQASVPKAIMANGIEFKGSTLSIQHSTVAIVKPRAKTQDMAKKEVEEAVRKAELGKGFGDTDEAVRRYSARNALETAAIRAAVRSRSRSRGDRRSRGRSRSRSPARRDRRRSPSPGWSRRGARRSRSPSPRRRSRDRDRRRRSPSRDRDRRRRISRSPSDSRRRRSRDRSRDQDRNRDRNRDRERDRDKDRRDKDRKEREKGHEKDVKDAKKESSIKEKDRQGEATATRIEKKDETDVKKPEAETPAQTISSVSTSMDLESDRLVEDLLEKAELESRLLGSGDKRPADVQESSSADTRPKRFKESPKEEEIKKEQASSSPRSLGDAKREAISDEDENETIETAPQTQPSKSSGKKKEKRKKEKKEKKKKRSSKKKKAGKRSNASSGSEVDGASTSSSD